MATIQKGAKINFYKFVQVQSPTSSAVRSDESTALTKTINTNTLAVNNLGATVNSIGRDSFFCKEGIYSSTRNGGEE